MTEVYLCNFGKNVDMAGVGRSRVTAQKARHVDSAGGDGGMLRLKKRIKGE
jgi:hypothetical protein